MIILPPKDDDDTSVYPRLGILEPISGYAIDIPLGDQNIPDFWKDNAALVQRIMELRQKHGIVIEDDKLVKVEVLGTLKPTKKMSLPKRKRQ